MSLIKIGNYFSIFVWFGSNKGQFSSSEQWTKKNSLWNENKMKIGSLHNVSSTHLARCLCHDVAKSSKSFVERKKVVCFEAMHAQHTTKRQYTIYYYMSIIHICNMHRLENIVALFRHQRQRQLLRNAFNRNPEHKFAYTIFYWLKTIEFSLSFFIYSLLFLPIWIVATTTKVERWLWLQRRRDSFVYGRKTSTIEMTAIVVLFY